jgi:hypothetical protein
MLDPTGTRLAEPWQRRDAAGDRECWSINVLPSLFYQIGLLVALVRACSSTWYQSQEVLSSRPDRRNIK